MALAPQLIEAIQLGGYDHTFSKLYCTDDEGINAQRLRFIKAIGEFEATYGRGHDLALYSSPGRTEIGGNHVDHNNGQVLAAAINLDIIAVVAKSDAPLIRVCSKGFPGVDEVSLDNMQPDEAEYGQSSALIRGVAAGIKRHGGKVGGLDIYTTSNVLKGSGLSSSAAFETCIGVILSGEFNNGRFSAIELGLIGQYAENVFFGKPSGLMDQLACAVGGAITIDFCKPDSPVVDKIPVDLNGYGFKLVITDTKGDHADLTDDYASIRSEMESVAACFGKAVLRQVEVEEFYTHIASLRAKVGDRALLRAIHYYDELRRVKQLSAALGSKDFPLFLRTLIESGHSSFEYNQNAYSPNHLENQEIPLALALSQRVLEGKGAWRLQGGGFAGTIQAFVPEGLVEEYCRVLGGVFGDDACHILSIRAVGSTPVIEKL